MNEILMMQQRLLLKQMQANVSRMFGQHVGIDYLGKLVALRDVCVVNQIDTHRIEALEFQSRHASGQLLPQSVRFDRAAGHGEFDRSNPEKCTHAEELTSWHDGAFAV